jgi:hypothetical protein
MRLDVLYSLVAHEAPECLYDLLNNIARFHPGVRVGVVCHLNPLLHPAVRFRLRGVAGVWVNPACWSKRWCSSDLLAAHVENFRHVETLGVEAAYFIPLASNCAFHRPVTRAGLDAWAEAPRAGGPMPALADAWAWRAAWEMNVELREGLRARGVDPCWSYHEGAILRFGVFRRIVEDLAAMRWREVVRCELPFEEVLLPALHRRHAGGDFGRLCAVEIARMPAGEAAVPFIAGLELPCVKPVRRVFEDPVRRWLRSAPRPEGSPFWVEFRHRPRLAAVAGWFWGGRARVLGWLERRRRRAGGDRARAAEAGPGGR